MDMLTLALQKYAVEFILRMDDKYICTLREMKTLRCYEAVGSTALEALAIAVKLPYGIVTPVKNGFSSWSIEDDIQTRRSYEHHSI